MLERLNALMVPPRWRHVWAAECPDADIQARGIDARGRVQYRYSAEHQRKAADNKFHNMLHFAGALPRLDANVVAELGRQLEAPDADQITVLAVRILMLGLFRVGNDKYAQQNHTYGLTTLMRKHIRTRGSILSFDFVGKEHVRQKHEIQDPKAATVVNRLLQSGESAEDLLFVTPTPPKRKVTSASVNCYIHAVSGTGASAKVFRTWGATVIAASVAGGARFDSIENHRDPNLVAYDAAAFMLGNTPAMARSSYVHPLAIEVGRTEAVRVAVAEAIDRAGTEEVQRMFTNQQLQSVIRQELAATE